MSASYTIIEKELLLSKQAVANASGSVLLLPEQAELCKCLEPEHAQLVAKLFNNAEVRMGFD